jgi:UDP-N-acetylmuramoylalanine--D-glutamate ligase
MRDLDTLTSWNSDWSGLRVAVLGLGVTGFAVADTLVELGAVVLVVAERATSELLGLSTVIGAPAVLAPGDSVPAELVSFGAEIAVVSPGFPAEHPWIRFLLDAGVAIWGDIELGWRLRDKAGDPAEWLLVAGGAGHVLASGIAEHLLVGDGYRVIAVGDNGIPLLDAVRDPLGYQAIIVCLSPAQLHWLPRTGSGALLPAASACTVSRDLSDLQLEQVATIYFGTRIACLYNTGDSATMRMVEDAHVQEGCRAIGFGLGAPGPSDVGVVDGIVIDRAFHDDRRTTALELTTRGELEQLGLSSALDATAVLVGVGFARLCGVPADAVSANLSTFTLD